MVIRIKEKERAKAVKAWMKRCKQNIVEADANKSVMVRVDMKDRITNKEE